MKKYRRFDYRTLLLFVIVFLSSYTCYHFQLSLYLDFLIVGLLIAFPLTLTIKKLLNDGKSAPIFKFVQGLFTFGLLQHPEYQT